MLKRIVVTSFDYCVELSTIQFNVECLKHMTAFYSELCTLFTVGENILRYWDVMPNWTYNRAVG